MPLAWPRASSQAGASKDDGPSPHRERSIRRRKEANRLDRVEDIPWLGPRTRGLATPGVSVRFLLQRSYDAVLSHSGQALKVDVGLARVAEVVTRVARE